MKIKIASYIILLTIFFSSNLVAFAQEEPAVDGSKSEFSWPIEIESKSGIVTTLYQPQLDSFEDNILEGRMAVTIKPLENEMIFGAIWFKARLQTDLEERTVVLEKMDIIKTHFPEMVEQDTIDKFSGLLAAEIESWDLEMSLDRILASLEEVENMKKLSDDINNDPPVIYFRNKPTILLIIDGEPILKEIEDADIEYVVNTPFFLVKDSKKGNYYINGGPFWYTSEEITKGWVETNKVPSNIEQFAKDNQEEQETDSIAEAYTEAPDLIIDTKAAELILVDGEIDYKAIEGTSLLFVSNSESDIIMDISSQNHYILLGGRWFYSKSLEDGDWKFSEPEDLPEDFNNIPEGSEMADVRPSIPGTPEAQTALLEQSIPQTATIDRSEAKVEVKYDGDPKFEKIEGTDVSYAVNTDKTVLLIKKVYYVVDDAVWFMSDKPTGPWEVSTERPDEVNDIPPESPVYNVKYAYIYDSTPTVVYVGYLPGYTYSYVYGGVVVYGTGYYYQPWYGAYYYPRPVTWGFGVHYNPWTGWGFSVGFSYGWMRWSFHPYRRGYWGARGYRHGYRHGYSRGYRHGYNHGRKQGYRAGYAAGSRNSSRNRNVYNNRSTGVKNTGNARNKQASNNMNNKARTSNKSNNMYTDKSGNVYQRDKSGNYQNKSNNQQQAQNRQQTSNNKQQVQNKSQQSTQQQRQPSSSQKQNMDRSHQNRSTGTQNYNRSQQQRSSGGSRSGGSRGGGGRRR